MIGHFEHADLVGRPEAVFDRTQDTELVAAFALEVEHRVDHVFEHLGPGDLALFGDMADQHDDRCRFLGVADQLLSAPRTWLTVPGAESRLSRYMVWIESMITRSARSAVRLAMMSRTLVAAARPSGRCLLAQASGAQAHLIDGLPRRRDRHSARRARQGCRRLQSMVDFADAGIASPAAERILAPAPRRTRDQVRQCP